jgi:anti-sigma factor RsiW
MLPRWPARLRLGPWKAALAVAAGLILAMVVLGAAAKLTQAGPSAQPIRAEAAGWCSSGDEVSDFVCRNTWLGQHRRAYR